MTDFSTDAQGNAIATETVYTYDSSGNRVRQDTTVSTNGVAGPTTTQLFLIDANNPTNVSQVLEVRNAAGTPTQTYLVGDSLLGQVNSANNLLLFQVDGEGSTRQLTNAQGQVTAGYSYDAFGNAQGFNPAAAATTILYTGAYYDSQVAEYNLRSRDYDPTTGRFDRMDTYGGDPSDPQSLERYVYTHNDPIDNTDPTGKLYASVTDLLISGISGSWSRRRQDCPRPWGSRSRCSISIIRFPGS